MPAAKPARIVVDAFTAWRHYIKREASKHSGLGTGDYKQKPRVNWEHLGKVIEVKGL